MSLEQIAAALDSLLYWPGKIGIIGGEPLLHTDFVRVMELIRERFPAEKMGLWTSGGKNYRTLLPDIQSTFDYLAYNEHNPEQLKSCKHQPLTVAIKEVITDEKLRKSLINDCWVQRTWCPTINHYGAYFCEVAAAQDVLLNDGENAWPVEPMWWRKYPGEFAGQVETFCDNCGMAIPMERELILNKTEKFSPALLQRFRQQGLKKVADSDVELFSRSITTDEIIKNIPTWTPGNYRGDLREDEIAPEGRGFTKTLECECLSDLTVELITIWYNEEFLAPFFLNHYSWVDKIHLLIDADTNDGTAEIAGRYPNVEITYVEFPDMMDDQLKANQFNSVYRSIVGADYVIVVDSDEFVFCNQIEKPVKTHIGETLKDVYFVHLWQIYDHESDLPPDPSVSVPLQRRHGDPNIRNNATNLSYVKPCIVKGGLNIVFDVGNHQLQYDDVRISIFGRNTQEMIRKNVTVRPVDTLQGSHWKLVGLERTIKRRITDRKLRQSKNNLKNNFSYQYHDVTEDEIIREYEANKNNPVVISDRLFT